MIAAREVRRRYLALAHGALGRPADAGIDAPIGRDPVSRVRMAVDWPVGQSRRRPTSSAGGAPARR
jgi:23S rRNA-/tRNA-specific pseudouridylate synthase